MTTLAISCNYLTINFLLVFCFIFRFVFSNSGLLSGFITADFLLVCRWSRCRDVLVEAVLGKLMFFACYGPHVVSVQEYVWFFIKFFSALLCVLFAFEWGFECLRKLYLHTAVSFILCLVFVGVWMSSGFGFMARYALPVRAFSRQCQRKLVNLKISSVLTCCQKNEAPQMLASFSQPGSISSSCEHNCYMYEDKHRKNEKMQIPPKTPNLLSHVCVCVRFQKVLALHRFE